MARAKTTRRQRSATPKRHGRNVTRTHLYQLDFIPEDDGSWTIDVPDLPGCVTWGKTKEEALRNAHDAILLYIDVLREEGSPIPHGVAVLERPAIAVTV